MMSTTLAGGAHLYGVCDPLNQRTKKLLVLEAEG